VPVSRLTPPPSPDGNSSLCAMFDRRRLCTRKGGSNLDRGTEG
jgi:hypothetical protein